MKAEEKFLLGALLGGAIGAASALFFAPMTGKNFRNKLAKGFSIDLDHIKRKAPKSAKAKRHVEEHEPIKRTKTRRRSAHS